MRKVLLLLAIMALSKGDITIGNSPTVTTGDGTLMGDYGLTAKNNTYARFLGIPFTVPMINNLRFKAPLKADSWVGVRLATQACPACLQPQGAGTVGSEVCTCINVVVPLNVTLPKHGLPVCVYVHGGGFATGNSALNQDLFTDKHIIFVSIQYRLGALGFLSLQTKEVPGNAGMKDQVMALEWVRDNIGNFGGNPDKVTILGVSAGAASVQLLQLSRMAKGLFKRVIAVSGSALCPWAIQRDPMNKTTQLVTSLGLNISSPTLLQDLQGVSATSIVTSSIYVTPTIPGGIQEFAFAPVIEYPCHSNCFLGDTPLKIMRSGKYNQAESLISCNSMEYLTFYFTVGNASFIDFVNSPNVVVPVHWQSVLSEEDIIKYHKILLKQYLKSETFDILDRDQFKCAQNLLGDVMMYMPMYKSALELAKSGTQHVYFEEFSVMGYGSFYFSFVGMNGSSHGFQILYFALWPNLTAGDYTLDGYTRRTIMEIYDNFIRQGDPTPGTCTDLLPNKWLPVTKKIGNYMSFNRFLVPSVDPIDCRRKLWKRLEKQVFSGHKV